MFLAPITTKAKDSSGVVVQHNDLVTARYILSIDGLRMLLLLLSKVNQREKNPGVICITASEFQEAFGLSNKNVYRCMNNALESLWEGHIEILRSNGQSSVLRISRWITDREYWKEDGKHVRVSITLNPQLDPYLFNIASSFTWASFKALQQIKSVNSFRLYMYLISLKNHPSCKRKGFFEVDLQLCEFKKLFPTASDRFSNLYRYTIVPCINDINRNTNLSVHCQTIKESRSVTAIRFGCVEETASISKPARPRLAKRPHVTAGSHAEGEWMKTNAEILYQYEKSLKEYDPELKLDMPDLRRAIACARLFKPDWHREKLAELQKRQRKPQPKATA